MMDRFSAALAASLAVCVAGCYDIGGPSQYQTYDQLLSQGDGKDGPGKAAAQAAADPPPVDPPVSASEPENSTRDVTPGAAATPARVAIENNSRPDDASNAAIVPKSLASFVPKPGGIQLLVDEPKFRADASTGALRVSYDDIDLFRILNMEPVPDNAVDYFPDWLKALEGKRIRIRGFMYTTFESTGLEGFVLARDTGLCCFGPNAKIYYLIGVSLQPGKTVDYTPNRPFDVVGRFRIEMLTEGGRHFGLYWIDDAQVIWR